ncbi:MAG TPA: hypothetical protein VJB06_02715 [archaeon]|nr:hypothetical protein [archaeon]
MGLSSELLKNVSGKASASINISGKEVLAVSLDGKEITIDVKDPFAVLDFGLDRLKTGKSGTVQKLKDSGFKIKLKYKMFKVEL